MKKTVLFVLLEQYADWEAAYLGSALTMLGEGNFEVKTVSLSRDSVQSIGGLRVTPDFDVLTAPLDYAGLILIGGMTWHKDSTQQLRFLVDHCCNNGKVLGGICAASAFLGTLGVLNKVKHTSNDLEDMKQWAGSAYTNEANYLWQQAVRDNNIITANGTAALEFAQEVLLALQVAPEEKIAEWYNFHKLGYYAAPLPRM